ncbi:SDR family NAD(P)-dependent oxidoreductase [Arthrobacter sp. B6]|uniref:SDR family NAD(P)-dependent oxidoreductase n=1 Tax=Arthrobacter sp. B6 TaxID=1570137 RepID=UPI000830F2F7|nr:SDR family NAD(P)-dependent oxidoreductase [Arthrobacter sp. B6]
MGQEFNGKTLLVTGGGSGIGEAVVLKMAAEGASILVVDLNEEAASSVSTAASSLGGRAIAFRADVANPEDMKRAVETASSEFGGLHLAFNNAGIGGPLSLLADTDVNDYTRVMEVNLHAAFYAMRYEIPAIIAAGGGSIVNTSSVLGLVGDPLAAPYVAAKHGLTGLTKAAALGYADQGVRVNSIHPGYIDTPLLEKLPEKSYSNIVAKHPIGRLGTAAEIAEMALFLFSDKASFITGSQFTIDGGYTAR